MKNDKQTEKKKIATVIAELVKTARKSKRLSQYRLAKDAGITPVHVREIEHGVLSPRVDTLNKICKTLQMEIQLPIY